MLRGQICISPAQRNPETVPGYKIMWNNNQPTNNFLQFFLLQPDILYFALVETGEGRGGDTKTINTLFTLHLTFSCSNRPTNIHL